MTVRGEADIVAQRLEEEAERFFTFTGIQRPHPDDVFIVVMGMTGSGKSTFISRCTGHDVVVGHGLHSCVYRDSRFSPLNP
jgi:ABC-type lipoprotein export system ATPase subunit